MGDELVEKKCSRCQRISWDSDSGYYGEICSDKKMCDTNGAVYKDGVRQ